jgi:hypothetical protein
MIFLTDFALLLVVWFYYLKKLFGCWTRELRSREIENTQKIRGISGEER